MATITPYIKRPVKFIKQVEFGDWRIKVYGVSVNTIAVPDELITKAIDKVLPHLPQPANTEDRYGVGFLIIHQGTLRNWFLLDWWEHEDILFNNLFSSPLTDPNSITPEQENLAVACVHELRVINFESEAWTKTVLREDSEPNFNEYMKLRFDRDEKLTG
jgi:hypothetical protein